MKIGDLVTRNSHDNDIIFTIVDIEQDNYYLKGINVRLYADSPLSDLTKYDNTTKDKDEEAFLSRIKEVSPVHRDEYFYLPGKIVHIDGDKDYLNNCLKYYEQMNVAALGINENEVGLDQKIYDILKKHHPNILVITGHDAYYKKLGPIDDLKAYKNSLHFVKAIEVARQYEPSQDRLIIIAGACQSNYEALIKAGANFASSPKRINIHALDPAIIATTISLSDRNKDIDVKKIIESTKYGEQGIGGLITKGTMYIGYPR